MEFRITTRIPATAESIYKTWLDSEGHGKMTGGEASITDRIGADFTAWDGYIKGKNIALKPDKRILQRWRTTQFEAGKEDSLLEIILQEVDGQTELTLTQARVPESGAHYIQGWETHYFKPMKAYFLKTGKKTLTNDFDPGTHSNGRRPPQGWPKR
jgi:activator of HSP90 ATPase